MEKRPVVYKRRPRKPLSDIASNINASDAHDNRGSPLSLVVSADGNGTKSNIVAKNDRKSWVDRSLSSKGRRSSLSLGEEYNLSDMVDKWVGTLFGSRDMKPRQNGEGNLRDQPTKKPSVVHRSKRVNPPVEFVKEKQAMFAEIDAFELESEEESPLSKPRPQEWVTEHLDVSKEVFSRKCALEIVPEDEFEEFADCLSSALLTPQCIANHSHSRELSPQSLSSRSSSSHDNDNSVKQTLRLDSEDYGPQTPSCIDESACDQFISNTEVLNVHSDWPVGFDEFFSPRANETKSSLDCNLLVSGLGSLQIGEDCRISGGGQNLNPLVEDDEEEGSKVIENEGAKDIELFRQSGEILLGTCAKDLLPIFEALLKECHQTRPLSLRDAITDFCDLAELVKVGEGTFGEAFKGGGCVFKIVPMDGDFLVNAEVQKTKMSLDQMRRLLIRNYAQLQSQTSAEIYSEVLLTNTLNRLRGLDLHDSTSCANYCTNFIETKAICHFATHAVEDLSGCLEIESIKAVSEWMTELNYSICICQGSYEIELCLAWEEWDAARTSDNDHPMLFPQDQLYVVFVLADGGKDLETFVLSNFSEARSLLLQVVLALGVAEEGCGFEHRDLHWGNIVLAREEEDKYGHYRLLDEDLKVKTSGLCVSIIDFTLSRIDTGKHVFFCNLSADPSLFEGPFRDTQTDTYRRMLTITKGNWEGSFPQTNCYWIHYLADILLKKKSYHCTSQEKRALRSFCKRVLLYESAKAAVSDDFFHDMWIRSSE